MVAFLLDARIRELTQNKKSLDDVMREVYRGYSGEQGYTEQEFRKVASKVAGKNLAPWFDQHVDQAIELDYQPALNWLGLEMQGWGPSSDDGEPEDKRQAGPSRHDGARNWRRQWKAGGDQRDDGITRL